jgi:hypothetical protein
MEGRKTSEFISSWVASIAAGGYGMTSSEPMVQASGILALGFIMGMYALSRGNAKKGA